MYCAHAGFRAALTAAVLCWSFPEALADATPDLRHLSFHPAPVTDANAPGPFAGGLPLEEAGDAANGQGRPQAGAEDYLEAIRVAEEAKGPWAEVIAEHSLALATLYRRSGRPREALAALEKALQVTRVNRGLFDASQLPIVRQMIDTYIQLDDLEEAYRKEEYLFYVQRRSYRGDDPRLLAAVIEWADWNVNMHLQERSLGQARPYIPRERYQPGPPLISPRLQHAKDLYHAALKWLHDSGVEDPRVVSTERKLAALNYIVDQELIERQPLPASAGQPDGHPSRGGEQEIRSFQFHEGSDALKRAIAYSYNSSNREYQSIAQRIMELGDWYLLFDRRTDALETYEEALAVLSASSLSEQEIERIMTPGTPVPIPDIDPPEAGAPPSPADYKGYIDVEFTLSRFGLASHPRIIGSSPGSLKAVERELFRTIHDCKFRPKLAKGDETGDEKTRLRYYYTY